MRQTIKSQLKRAGFNGRIFFRKHNEFGTPDNYGPAIHRRWMDSRDCDEVVYAQDRNGFDTVVIYLEPKSYYETLQRLNNPKHIWTEGEINGLRKNLGYCTNWSKVASEDVREDIQRGLYTFKFRITKEQTKFGLDWLKRTQWKLNGELRAGAFIGEREARIIQKFSHFEFVGLDFMNLNNYTGFPEAIAPLYKTIAKNGESFTYRVCPMHTGFGANYEVVS